jgi:hypothetical protein
MMMQVVVYPFCVSLFLEPSMSFIVTIPRKKLNQNIMHQQLKEDNTEQTYPYRTSIVSDSRRKFHTTYQDGSEMVEEYDLNTNELLVRKTRQPTKLGGEGEWQFELGGEQFVPFHPMKDLFAVSSKNVSISYMNWMLFI